MKKFIPVLSLAVAIAACNTNPELITRSSAVEVQAPINNPDTLGLSEYQLWKAQNELRNERDYNQPAEYAAAAPVKKKAYKAPVNKTLVASTSPRSTSTKNSRSNSQVAQSNEEAVVSNEGAGQNSGASEAGEETKKEGMSKAAKGAVIGGAGGATAGAIINKKNRAAGAVIGGVIGAGGGYVVGRKMDKKDGRN